MPTDTARQRPGLEGQRTGSSNRVLRTSIDATSDSPASTPPTHHKTKGAKAHHVVGGRSGLHSRNLSHGKLHKAKAHSESKRNVATPSTSPGTEPVKRVGSEGKISREGSTTSLKKNSSHTTLSRNRSAADVRKPKSAAHLKRSASHSKVHNNKALQKTSVHFDLGHDGNDDADGDGWTEASGSASPNLSRSGSVAGQSSGRNSAKQPASTSNSQQQSPQESPTKAGVSTRDWTSSKQNSVPDPSQITSRLLQRTPSHNAPPKMSEISATATSGLQTPSSSSYHRTPSTSNGTPHSTKGPVVSRFVDEPDRSPADNSPLLTQESKDLDAARKSRSMGNLTRHNSNDVESDEERPLAPRSRKGSAHAYKPPQQSRTQQKLWLQRASSNIEPQQLAPSATIAVNGFPLPPKDSSPLVGAGYDGRDPRVKAQLEKTGMEYLVVRRYQDPVGRALRRLAKLPGNEKMRRIPSTRGKINDSGANRYGLSQSMTERSNKDGTVNANGAKSSYNESVNGSVGSVEGGQAEDGGISAMLRSMWEKSSELSPSVE